MHANTLVQFVLVDYLGVYLSIVKPEESLNLTRSLGYLPRFFREKCKDWIFNLYMSSLGKQVKPNT